MKKVFLLFLVSVCFGFIVLVLSIAEATAQPQGGSCPCNFDFRFWTNPNWILTSNGLFDDCLSNQPDDISIEGLEILGEVGKRALVEARLTASGNRCAADIFASPFDSGGLIRLYLESHDGITDQQLNNCIRKIKRIAEAYGLCV